MRFPFTLLLVSVLHSGVLSLVCQYCITLSGSAVGTCREINCPDQCVTVTLFEEQDGKNFTSVFKTCGVSELCSIQTVNMGEVKLTRNAKCCNTTLCNTETLPVLPSQRANGKMCYSCKNNDCSRTVDCADQENYCISQEVTQLGKTLTMKGCAYKTACGASALLTSQGIDTGNSQCCQGNLCNGAEGLTVRFLLMFISLISSILFS